MQSAIITPTMTILNYQPIPYQQLDSYLRTIKIKRNTCERSGTHAWLYLCKYNSTLGLE